MTQGSQIEWDTKPESRQQSFITLHSKPGLPNLDRHPPPTVRLLLWGFWQGRDVPDWQFLALKAWSDLINSVLLVPSYGAIMLVTMCFAPSRKRLFIICSPQPLEMVRPRDESRLGSWVTTQEVIYEMPKCTISPAKIFIVEKPLRCLLQHLALIMLTNTSNITG